ncbi:hypothetical protein [Limnofasciculus baicalensis]|uniref:Uncharacterized protein n=1 Tax=Limnofasciculus baicalensis BBK-W-15 TaxID=2699891 RepID=A0AAE3KPG2_9CYAN|nr:hypothetical protein [Limnofasciculus baicalensis]MCP2731294.1 hypothetical protein [Limnofasciculus baicalensis BBK-W-15]
MSETFDSKWVSPLKHAPKVAIYTLATIAAQGLPHPALSQSSLGIDYAPPSVALEEAHHDDGMSIQSSEQGVGQEEQSQRRSTGVKNSIAVSVEPESTISPEFLLGQEFGRVAIEGIEITEKETANSILPMVEPSVANANVEEPKTGAKELTQEYRADRVTPNNSGEGNLQPATEGNNSDMPQQSCQAILAQAPSTGKSCVDIDTLQQRLRQVEELKVENEFRASPSLSIAIPTGFGADQNTLFVSGTYQEQTRYTDDDDGAVGIGIGLGDAQKSVGVEFSYTLASFGTSRDFGSGGFNVKLHRQFAQGWAVAAGWNGILNLGDGNDFEHSIYGTVSKIFRTQTDITRPFSRIAFTAGVGSGQFRTEDAVDDDDYNVNVFGNVAVRIAQPVSLIAEWSGQDLGVGLSIAPFKNIPFVITPALRDITGAGDEARFVLGTGFAIKF